jgi:hypothetical protein
LSKKAIAKRESCGQPASVGEKAAAVEHDGPS